MIIDLANSCKASCTLYEPGSEAVYRKLSLHPGSMIGKHIKHLWGDETATGDKWWQGKIMSMKNTEGEGVVYQMMYWEVGGYEVDNQDEAYDVSLKEFLEGGPPRYS